MTQAPPPAADLRLQRSSRDAESLPGLLAEWLATRLPEGAEPEVTLHRGIDTNGMSSETLVLDVTWTEDGQRRTGEYVARVAPAAEDVPVFASYALADQYDTMRQVAELTDVPVPAVRWMEQTGEVLGTPFFLMDRIDGARAPGRAALQLRRQLAPRRRPDEQRRLQDATVDVVARLHAIHDADHRFAFLDPDRPGATPLARNLAHTRAWYDFAVPDLGRSPVVERALAWLEAHLPGTDEAVLCWGDSRIGNVIYRDFDPVAVLDWEMATIGPRELDVSWLVFAHQVFETIAGALELPGMPHFLREDDVRATYAARAGVELGDLSWYHVYNAVQWCVVFMRTGARQIHFGEIERPDDLETLFHHKPLLERLLADVGA